MTDINFALLGDRIAITLDQAEDKTPGGIVLPDDAKEKTTTGTVRAVGPGQFSERHLKHVPLSVKRGDRIAIGRYSGTDLKVNGESYTVIHESDVIAILPAKS